MNNENLNAGKRGKVFSVTIHSGGVEVFSKEGTAEEIVEAMLSIEKTARQTENTKPKERPQIQSDGEGTAC